MTSSSIIRPSDFNRNTADPQRNTWQPGQLRHVMKAIAAVPGARTLVETMEGLLQNYTIIGFGNDWAGYNSVLRTEYAPGKFQDTRFSLFKLGAVIVLDLPITVDVRYTAMNSYREEAGRLFRRAQELHGEVEGRKCGKWEATPGMYDDSGYVTYEPWTGNPAFADEWGTRWYGEITLPKVAA
jgi:hypothetical protein